ELLSDGIAGGVGLAVFSLAPGGRVLKLGSALLAGGATKHELALVGLGGDANAPLKNFAWGGVDALAMVSGAAVRDKMMGSFEASITSAGAKDIAWRGGVTQAGKLSVFDGKFVLEHMGGYRDAAVMLEGKSGLDGLKTATEMLSENVAAKRAAYKAELSAAIARAPWYEKPAVWLQDKSFINVGDSAWLNAKKDYLAARGSSLSYLNPINVFRSPAQFDGSLQSLKSITFWNRYKIDALSVGATSLVYRGTHEAAKIGDTDPTTGKAYSAYDAVANTVSGAAGDAVKGGFMVGALRSLGASLGPKLDWAGRTLAGGGMTAEHWLAPTARAGLASIPTAGALFSPELDQAWADYHQSSKYEEVLKQIQKPLEDK